MRLKKCRVKIIYCVILFASLLVLTCPGWYLNLLMSVSASAADINQADITDNDTTIYVEKVVTTSSEILSEAEIAGITEKYEDRNLTMEEIKQIAAEINQLYTEKGYIARAYLLPQEVEDNIIKINLVEGRFGGIDIKNNEYTKTDYIKKRLSLQSGDLVDLTQLENDLYYFNSTNNIKLKANLKSGQEYGTTDLILNTQEPERINTSLFVDNAGRKETGLFRLGLTTTINSPLGRGDSFSLSAIKGEGLLSGSVFYSVPVHKDGRKLTIGYSENQTNIITGPMESVDISGGAADYTVGINRPLLIKPEQNRNFSLEIHRKESGNYFSEAKLLSGEISSVVAGLSGQKRENNLLRTYSQYLTTGYSVSSEKEVVFYKYNGNLLWQRLIKNNRIFNLQLQWQYTDDKLIVSSEQFSLGGMNNVKGYPQGLLIGNSGYYLGAELDIPVTNSIMGIISFDHGGVFPYKGNDEEVKESDYLNSISLGTNIQMNEGTLLKVIYARPLSTLEDYSKPRIHFTVQINF